MDRNLLGFMQNIFICVWKLDENLIGLKWHESSHIYLYSTVLFTIQIVSKQLYRGNTGNFFCFLKKAINLVTHTYTYIRSGVNREVIVQLSTVLV